MTLFAIILCSTKVVLWHARYGPLARYVKLRVRMRRECQERFPRHRRWAIPTCITARASRTCRNACRDRQLSVSFEIGGGGKRSRHSRRMRNLQFYVSGKRPIEQEGKCSQRVQAQIIYDIYIWCIIFLSGNYQLLVSIHTCPVTTLHLKVFNCLCEKVAYHHGSLIMDSKANWFIQ